MGARPSGKDLAGDAVGGLVAEVVIVVVGLVANGLGIGFVELLRDSPRAAAAVTLCGVGVGGWGAVLVWQIRPGWMLVRLWTRDPQRRCPGVAPIAVVAMAWAHVAPVLGACGVYVARSYVA